MTDFQFFTSGSKSSGGKDAVADFLALGEAQHIIKCDDTKTAKSLRTSIANHLAKLDSEGNDDGWRIMVRLSGDEVGLLLLTHQDVPDALLTSMGISKADGSMLAATRQGAIFTPEQREAEQAKGAEDLIAKVTAYRQAHPQAAPVAAEAPAEAVPA